MAQRRKRKGRGGKKERSMHKPWVDALVEEGLALLADERIDLHRDTERACRQSFRHTRATQNIQLPSLCLLTNLVDCMFTQGT